MPLGTQTVPGGCEGVNTFGGNTFLLPELPLESLESSASVLNDPDNEEGGDLLVPLEVEGGELL